jgi:hypothetical protein
MTYDQAVSEAKRRARMLGKSYSIYRSRLEGDQFILRPSVDPKPRLYERVCTVNCEAWHARPTPSAL